MVNARCAARARRWPSRAASKSAVTSAATVAGRIGRRTTFVAFSAASLITARYSISLCKERRTDIALRAADDAAAGSRSWPRSPPCRRRACSWPSWRPYISISLTLRGRRAPIERVSRAGAGSPWTMRARDENHLRLGLESDGRSDRIQGTGRSRVLRPRIRYEPGGVPSRRGGPRVFHCDVE